MESKKRSKLCYGLLLAFSIIFGVLLGDYSDANAVSVSSGIYSTAIYTKNFESTETRTSLGPVSTPFASVPDIFNPTGFWDYTQALSFANPYSNHVGTGFDSALYFTITAGDVNFPLRNENLGKLMANMKLGFEHLQNVAPYCTSTWKINNYTSNSIQFLLQSSCPAGSFPANTSFDEVEAFINFKPDSMFWCADDNPSRQCPGVISVAISNIDYYFGIVTEATSADTTIINQNQTIINQDNAYYQHEYDAENNISNQSTSDISGAENQQTTNIIGILTTFVTTLGSVQSGSCELTLPFPAFAGGNVLANPCSYKEKAPQIVTIGSSLLLIGVFIPLAYIVLKMIYNEIRSWTNG